MSAIETSIGCHTVSGICASHWTPRCWWQACAVDWERAIDCLRWSPQAAELAKLDGVSLNQFIAAAVAEKVGTIRTVRDFLHERAGSATPKDMMKYLRRAPKVAPTPGDER